MEKQFVAVFLMCMVVVAAVHIHKAEATTAQQFSDCYNSCYNGCHQDGKGIGATFCEMKCDADCVAKETKGTYQLSKHFYNLFRISNKQ